MRSSGSASEARENGDTRVVRLILVACGERGNWDTDVKFLIDCRQTITTFTVLRDRDVLVNTTISRW